MVTIIEVRIGNIKNNIIMLTIHFRQPYLHKMKLSRYIIYIQTYFYHADKPRTNLFPLSADNTSDLRIASTCLTTLLIQFVVRYNQ